jgi:RHS repeat-associated protein
MPGRKSNPESYRFGFNGKENDRDLAGGAGLVFKYRTADARIGRFFAVDPLSPEYPELTPYQVASNSPIYMIELEGLEGFIIHGTKQKRSDNVFSDGTLDQFMRVGENSYIDESFSWGEYSGQFNTRGEHRSKAAFKLANHVILKRQQLIASGAITDPEGITLIGYSHGGNVAIQAAEEIEERTGISVTIITVATPAYNGENIEDPATQNGIKHHIHIFSEGDGVDRVAQGSATYDNGKTANYEVGEDHIPHVGWRKTHSNLGDETKNTGLELFLEEVPSTTNIPMFEKTKKKDTKNEKKQDEKRTEFNSEN